MDARQLHKTRMVSSYSIKKNLQHNEQQRTNISIRTHTLCQMSYHFMELKLNLHFLFVKLIMH